LSEHSELDTDYQEYLNSLKNQEININEIIFDKFASSKSKQERQLLKELNLQELINESVRKELAGFKFASSQTQPPIPG
jgi:hypothetical protein